MVILYLQMTLKSNLAFLNAYKLIAKRDVKQKVEKIVGLYEARRISNVATAKNLLDKLTATNKNTIKSGLKLYDKAVAKYENAEPLPDKRKRVQEEKVQKVKREKATTKIQHFLGDKMKKIKRDRATLKIQNLLKKNNIV
jgi:hypothetical protein